MKTFIPGKDAALEDSILYFQQQLQALGFDIEEVSWLNPAPNVWSVHIRDKQCNLCFSNGKGTSKKAALASALGEYLERLSTNYFFADFYLGEDIAQHEFVHYPDEKWFKIHDDNSLPAGLLNKELLQFYDPENELYGSDLIDLQSGNQERGICALPFIQQSIQKSSQHPIYFPVNIIGNLYVSNGMSAGNTQNEARVQALSEILERFVKNKIIAEAISLPEIPQPILNRYPDIVKTMTALEDGSFHLCCYDASLGGQFPVICVVLLNSHNATCFASFGAHPNFGVALERTVTELLQGRSLNDLDVFSSPSFDNDSVAEQTNLETHFIDSSGLISWDLFKQPADILFYDWDFNDSTDAEFTTLMNIFTKQEKTVYIADYQHLGVHTCRIIVPGMSEIYPPCDLVFANNTMAAHLRDAIVNLPHIPQTTEQDLAFIDQLDQEGLDDVMRIRELLGIATGTENAWYTLRVGELKAMLALAGGDLEQALIWIEWTLEFNRSTFSAQRVLDYQCLQTLVTLAVTRGTDACLGYIPIITKLYGKTRVDTQWQYVLGKATFYGLFAIDKQFNSLKAHQALLNIYQKLHTAKSHYFGTKC